MTPLLLLLSCDPGQNNTPSKPRDTDSDSAEDSGSQEECATGEMPEIPAPSTLIHPCGESPDDPQLSTVSGYRRLVTGLSACSPDVENGGGFVVTDLDSFEVLYLDPGDDPAIKVGYGSAVQPPMGDADPLLAVSWSSSESPGGGVWVLNGWDYSQMGDVSLPDTLLGFDVAWVQGGLVAGAGHDEGERGAIYVFEGPWSAGMTDTDAVAVHRGGYERGYLGSTIESIGDVDADGVGDVLVYEAAAPVLLLGEDLWTDGGIINASALPVYWNRQADALGDFDGDGRDDLAVANRYNTTEDFGQVELYSGVQPEPFAILYDDGVIFGQVGEGVVGLGDLDGDGWRTIMVAEETNDDRSNVLWVADGPLCGAEVLNQVATLVLPPEGERWRYTVGGDELLGVYGWSFAEGEDVEHDELHLFSW